MFVVAIEWIVLNQLGNCNCISLTFVIAIELMKQSSQIIGHRQLWFQPTNLIELVG